MEQTAQLFGPEKKHPMIQMLMHNYLIEMVLQMMTLAGTFKSTVTFKPKRKILWEIFGLFLGLGFFPWGLYFTANIPITTLKWEVVIDEQHNCRRSNFPMLVT